MKNYHVIISKTAKEDLQEIARYIAKDNPVIAINFIKELTETLEKLLSAFPLSGVPYLGIEEDIRSHPYGRYVSFYKVKEEQKQVEVLHIFSASRDFDNLLMDL